jgi:hypothetical protein
MPSTLPPCVFLLVTSQLSNDRSPDLQKCSDSMFRTAGRTGLLEPIGMLLSVAWDSVVRDLN